MKTELQKATTIIAAVATAIKEAGAIPSGHLYAALNKFGCTIESYNRLIDALKATGKVYERNNLLYWID
jgi:hypothetical protein